MSILKLNHMKINYSLPIISIHENNYSKPDYRIIIQNICPDTQEMSFTLQSNNPINPPIKANAKEISADKILLDQLSPRDAHLIGYVLASEAK